jgi:hypothetical protein
MSDENFYFELGRREWLEVTMKNWQFGILLLLLLMLVGFVTLQLTGKFSAGRFSAGGNIGN